VVPTITMFNIDVIQRIMYPGEINPRVEGSSFILPLNELRTRQLPFCLQTPITSHSNEQFQMIFYTSGCILQGYDMIWVVCSGGTTTFRGTLLHPVPSQ